MGRIIEPDSTLTTTERRDENKRKKKLITSEAGRAVRIVWEREDKNRVWLKTGF